MIRNIDRIKKFDRDDLAHFDYLTSHKRGILLAFNTLMKVIDLPYEKAKELRSRALNHDYTKLANLDIFDAYTDKYHKRVKSSDYKNSVRKHYSEEKHHYESIYHGYRNEEMSDIDEYELCLDWCVMSEYLGTNTPLEYLYENKNNFLTNRYLKKSFPILESIFKSLDKLSKEDE